MNVLFYKKNCLYLSYCLAGSPAIPAGRFQHCLESPGKDDLVLIDKGDLTYEDSVRACAEESMQLVVIRKPQELALIQNLVGVATSFYLRGLTASNDTCAKNNCTKEHIKWLDGGNTFDSSLYNGSFLSSQVFGNVKDNCVQVVSTM